eukprot:3269843-Karenia_brevis.AAC.1
MRQWIPISKFVTITAIIGKNSNDTNRRPTTYANIECDTPCGVLRSLADYWKPFLDGSHSEINVHEASTVLSDLELNA